MQINNKDIELHNKKHLEQLEQNPEFIFKPRIKTLDYFQKKVKRIHGKVLDIGAGNGYASIWLAKNSDAEKIICLENSKAAVEKLIPSNIKYHKVDNIVEAKIGSFEDLRFKDYFDFIISFGSIHHSNCLLTCMLSIFNSLKKDGYLIMNEPSMNNFVSNEDYIKKYNSDEIFQGKKIKNFERNDKFYREAEYIVSAVYSGFDLKHMKYEKQDLVDFDKKFQATKYLLRNKKLFILLKKIFSFPFKIIKKTLFNKKKETSNKSGARPTIFFFQKKINNYIPHLWDKLK